MKKFIIALTALVFATSLFAKTGGYSSSSSSRSSSSSSGGYRSSSSSSSSRPSSSSGGYKSSSTPAPSKPGYSSSSSPKPSTPSASTPTKSSGYSSSSTKPSSTSTFTPSSSSSVNKLNRSAAVTPPKSKEQYLADFKKENEAKMPTKFSAEPTSRPSYIPSSATVNGSNYPVTFNPTYGSYGYMVGSIFTPYDPFPILGASSYNNYYNGYQRQYIASQPAPGGAMVIILCVVVAGIVIFCLVLFMRKNY